MMYGICDCSLLKLDLLRVVDRRLYVNCEGGLYFPWEEWLIYRDMGPSNPD